MMPLRSIAIFLIVAGSVGLLTAFVLWQPIPADVRRRVGIVARAVTARARANRGPAPARRSGTDVLTRLFTVGMPRRWGVSATALMLALVGLIAGGGAWLLSHAVFGLPPWAAIPLVALACWLAPRKLAGLEQERADTLFIELFPDAIDMVVRMLRAGLPVSEAIRTVAREAPAPINDVFTSLADQIEIGIAFEDALDVVSTRIGLPDFRFFAAAIALQRATGGNLTATLEILGDIIRKRRTVRLKARAASAEVRISAYVLGSMPFILFGAVLLFTPSYLTPLIADPRGNVILALAFAMLLLAFVTMRHMMRSAVRM